MREGRIVHFEDDPLIRLVVQRGLDNSPHRVVGGAGTLEEALEILEQIKRGELHTNVIMTDGNLSDVYTCDDARAIIDRKNELELRVRTVGLAGKALSDFGIEVDAELVKGCSTDEIVEVIDGLPELET